MICMLIKNYNNRSRAATSACRRSVVKGTAAPHREKEKRTETTAFLRTTLGSCDGRPQT